MRINQVARSVADAEELPRLIQLSENLFAASFFLMKLRGKVGSCGFGHNVKFSYSFRA
jgi:hypothetical protein